MQFLQFNTAILSCESVFFWSRALKSVIVIIVSSFFLLFLFSWFNSVFFDPFQHGFFFPGSRVLYWFFNSL